MDRPLRFGAFLAPYNEPRENPTRALERDLDLIVHLDGLGFDEAWVGEHHSTGWETIDSPELFLAVGLSAPATSGSAPERSACRTTTR